MKERNYRIVKITYDDGRHFYAIQRQCRFFKRLWKFYLDDEELLVWGFSKYDIYLADTIKDAEVKLRWIKAVMASVTKVEPLNVK